MVVNYSWFLAGEQKVDKEWMFKEGDELQSLISSWQSLNDMGLQAENEMVLQPQAAAMIRDYMNAFVNGIYVRQDQVML